MEKNKYRIILLDMQELYRTERLAAAGLPNAEILPELYDSRTEQEEECFFCEEYETYDADTAVKVGRGILFENNFTMEDTCTTVQLWRDGKWVNLE